MKKLMAVMAFLLCLSAPGCNATASFAPVQPNDTSPMIVPIAPTGKDYFCAYSYDGRGGVLASGSEYMDGTDGNDGRTASISRFKANGSHDWKCTLADCGFSELTDMSVGPDGIYACGWRGSPESGLVAKVSYDGKLLWKRDTDFPANASTGLRYAHCAYYNGGVITVATTTVYEVSYGLGYKPAVLCEYDGNGRLVWRHEIDFSGQADIHCLLPTKDGIYISLNVYPDDLSTPDKEILFKADSTGKEAWRRQLSDAEMQYTVNSLADTPGGLLASCSGRYTGKFTPSGKLTGFHAQFESWSKNPAALISLDSSGAIRTIQQINGAFGCSGGELLPGAHGYIQSVLRVDDVVPSLPQMNINFMTQGKTILCRYDENGKADSQQELTDRLILIGMNGDRPVLVDLRKPV